MLSFKEFNKAVKESFGGAPQMHDITGLKKVFPELLDKKRRRKYMIGKTPFQIQQEKAKRKALVKRDGSVEVNEASKDSFTIVDPFGGVKYKNVRRGYIRPGTGSRYRFKSIAHQEPSSFRNDFPIVRKFKDFAVGAAKKTVHGAVSGVVHGVGRAISTVGQKIQQKRIEKKQHEIAQTKEQIAQKKEAQKMLNKMKEQQFRQSQRAQAAAKPSAEQPAPGGTTSPASQGSAVPPPPKDQEHRESIISRLTQKAPEGETKTQSSTETPKEPIKAPEAQKAPETPEVKPTTQPSETPKAPETHKSETSAQPERKKNSLEDSRRKLGQLA